MPIKIETSIVCVVAGVVMHGRAIGVCILLVPIQMNEMKGIFGNLKHWQILKSCFALVTKISKENCMGGSCLYLASYLYTFFILSSLLFTIQYLSDERHHHHYLVLYVTASHFM